MKQFSLLTVLSLAHLVSGETVVLSPRTVPRLARTSSIVVTAGRHDTVIADLDRKAAVAAMLPSVKGQVTYTHLDEEPTISLGSSGGGLPASTGDPTADLVLGYIGRMFSGPISAGPQDMWSVGVTVTQPIFTGGKLLNGVRASAQAARSSRFSLERNGDKAAVTALEIYWGYVAAGEGLASIGAAKAWFEKLLANQQIMFDNGMILEHDLLKTRAAFAQVRLGEIQARNAVTGLGEGLLLFLGLPTESTISLDTANRVAADLSIDPPGEKTVAAAGQKRADLAAMRKQRDALSSVRKIQIGAHAPNIAAFYNQSWANDDPEQTDRLVGGWRVGAALDWNVFDWGRSYREVQKTDHRIEQLDLAIENSTRQVRTEIEATYRSWSESRESVTIASEGLENARRALEIAELKYAEGVISDIELLDSRKSLTEAETQVIRARTAREIAAARYALALGEPLGE